MSQSTAATRHVAVERLSFWKELAQVVRGAAMVVGAVLVYLAVTLGSERDTKRTLLPFQGLVQDRPPGEQRIFRELQEGLLEAESLRSTTGTWPSVEALVAQGIPPFAPDPTAKDTQYRWTERREGNYINYLGVPDKAGSPSWLLLVQEPEPGVPPDQVNEDEEHHRLLDGSMLHVSTWTHSDGTRTAPRVVRLPQAEGWYQLYAVGPGLPAPVAIMPQ